MQILYDAAHNRYLDLEAATEKDSWNVLQRFESNSRYTSLPEKSYGIPRILLPAPNVHKLIVNPVSTAKAIEPMSRVST
jgi:hypothetical protein